MKGEEKRGRANRLVINFSLESSDLALLTSDETSRENEKFSDSVGSENSQNSLASQARLDRFARRVIHSAARKTVRSNTRVFLYVMCVNAGLADRSGRFAMIRFADSHEPCFYKRRAWTRGVSLDPRSIFSAEPRRQTSGLARLNTLMRMFLHSMCSWTRARFARLPTSREIRHMNALQKATVRQIGRSNHVASDGCFFVVLAPVDVRAAGLTTRRRVIFN